MNENEFLLVRAAFKKPVERTPVWVMRQAGRYLPEYREVRAQAGNFLDLCQNPELAAEVSIQPLDLMDVDAVIMFSDILTPLMGMGMDLTFTPGPKFGNPVRSQQDVEKLRTKDPDESTPYVGKILDILKKEVGDRAPVIGFSGAPFTLASYMIEGAGSKLFSLTKRLFWEEPKTAELLMTKLTEMTIDYLNYQIEHGVSMVQMFDTWAGIFSAAEYKKLIFPYVQQIFSSLKGAGTIPKVYYVNGGNHLLELMADSGADVIGLDWMTDMKQAKKRIGDKVSLQGNLDPNVLFCKPEIIEEKVISILNDFGKDSGHIFNLGHGIDKSVDPEHLKFMIKTVKDKSVR